MCIVGVLAAQAWAISQLRPSDEPAPAHAAPRAMESGEPMGRLVNVLRRRRWLRRSLSFTSVAVMLVAVGMIGYPFYTNLYADRLQGDLDRQFSSDELRQDYENCLRVGL